MRYLLLLVLLLMAAPASASQPVSRSYGPWDVVGIYSLSGDDLDDATASIDQMRGANKLSVEWSQGLPVVVSMRIKDCMRGEDFNPSYQVDEVRWSQMSRREIVRRLKSDFSTWLSQARLMCATTVGLDHFQLDRIDDAIADFQRRFVPLAATD